MASTWTGNKPRELNEETIEAVRLRIGIPVKFSPRNHSEVANPDAFRHFARAYGDDNPLYSDPGYASASGWGSPIAPPLYPFISGIARDVELDEAERAIIKSGDPLAGIGQYMCGERWLFPRPVRAGDVLYHSQALHSAELRASTFGGGDGALVSHRHVWDDEAGEPFAFRFLDFWHADREKSRSTGKNRDLERTVYTDEEMARIEHLYESEAVRGKRPLLIGEVEIGEQLGPIAKGPLTVTDIVAWHAGVGWGMYGGGGSKVGFLNRRRVPKFYTQNEFGIWDTAQRCHWDDEWAQRMGHPAAYDYGVMRTNWMVHLVTNWMGDDAWLWRIEARARKFNYLGDAHFISGTVSQVDRSTGTVTIDATGFNQRGESTCDARLVVILPSEAGRVATIPAYHEDQIPEVIAP